VHLMPSGDAYALPCFCKNATVDAEGLSLPAMNRVS